MNGNRLLRRKAASEYLHQTHGLERAPSTLAKLAVSGGGPVFRHIGRVPLYAPSDLDAWVASKLGPRRHSTSEVAATVATTTAGDPKGSATSERRANSAEREGHSHV
jgi:hypothetical protein